VKISPCYDVGFVFLHFLMYAITVDIDLSGAFMQIYKKIYVNNKKYSV